MAIRLILKLERSGWYQKNRHFKRHLVVQRKTVRLEPFSRNGAKRKKQKLAPNSVNIGFRKIHTQIKNVPRQKMNKFCSLTFFILASRFSATGPFMFHVE